MNTTRKQFGGHLQVHLVQWKLKPLIRLDSGMLFKTIRCQWSLLCVLLLNYQLLLVHRLETLEYR